MGRHGFCKSLRLQIWKSGFFYYLNDKSQRNHLIIISCDTENVHLLLAVLKFLGTYTCMGCRFTNFYSLFMDIHNSFMIILN